MTMATRASRVLGQQSWQAQWHEMLQTILIICRVT